MEPMVSWLQSRAFARSRAHRDQRYVTRGFQPLHQAPLIGLLIALALFIYANPNTDDQWALFPIHYDARAECDPRYGFGGICEYPNPVPHPELEIHQDGYTLRFQSEMEIDIERKAGVLDTTQLVTIMQSIQERYWPYTRVTISVESSITLDEYIRTVDQLLSIDWKPNFHPREPFHRAYWQPDVGQK